MNIFTPIPDHVARADRIARRGRASRDWLVVLGIAIVSILIAAPGVHLFERWLAPMPAIVVSHGLALAGLGLAVQQWRARR